MSLFEDQVNKYGLDVPDNWKEDIRDLFISFFAPLTDDSDCFFVVNKTDSRSKILEIHKKGYNGRVGGISKLRTMDCWIFLSKDIFDVAQKKLGLPDNMQKTRSQPHIRVSLATVWNILCFLTGKSEFISMNDIE